MNLKQLPEVLKGLTKKQRLILYISLAAVLVAALTLTLVLVLGGGGEEPPKPETTFVADGLLYDRVDSSYVYLIGAEEGVTDVVIPSRIALPEGGERRVKVKENAFLNSDIEALTFESAEILLQSVEKDAFKNCKSLRKIAILEGETGAYASPEASFLEGCDAVAEVYGTTSALGYLAMDAGFSCDSVRTMTILPDSYGETGFEINGHLLSGYTGVQRLVYAEGITKIQYLSMPSLTEMVIPASATEGSNGPTVNLPKLERLYISDLAAYVTSLTFHNADVAKNRPNTNKVELYLNGELVTELVIPEGVTEISSNAFCNFKGFSKVTLPSTLKRIGYKAFHNSEIVQISIPDSVTSIDMYAFGAIPTLSSLKFGSGITKFSSSAFEAQPGLNEYRKTEPREIYNPMGLTLGAFDDMAIKVHTDANAESILIYIGDCVYTKLTDNKYYLVRYLKEDKHITLPESANGEPYYVYPQAFSNHPVVSLTVPEGVISCLSRSFVNCEDLVLVRFASNVNIADSWQMDNSPYMQIYHPKYDYSKGNVVYTKDASARSVIDITEEGLVFFRGESVQLIKYVGDGAPVTLPVDYEGGSYSVPDGVLERVSTVVIPDGNKISLSQKAFGNNTTVFEKEGCGYYIGNTFFGIAADENPETLAIREGTVAIAGDITVYIKGKTVQLKTVTLPSTLKTVEADAFRYARALLHIEASCTLERVGAYAFSSTDGVGAISEIRLASGATVSAFAFNKLSLEGELTLLGAVKLEADAFRGAKIEIDSLVIPADSDVGKYALSGVKFGSLTIGDGVKLHHQPGLPAALERLTVGKNVDLQMQGVYTNGGLFQYTTVAAACFDTLADWIHFLEESGNTQYARPVDAEGLVALYFGGEPVTEITIPVGKEDMLYRIAGNVKTLRKLVIPDAITRFDAGSFANCTALEELVLGTGLVSVQIPASIKKLHVSSLEGWLSLTDASSSRSHYENITLYLDGAPLTAITVPESITTLRAYAFYGFAGIESIALHDGVTTARSYSMYNSSLARIEGGERLGTVEDNAILNMDVVPTFTSGNVIYRFNHAVGVVSKDITWARVRPNTVIPDLLFADCDKLTYVYIHDGCTLGQRVFAGANVNITVYFEGSFPQNSSWKIASKNDDSLTLGQFMASGGNLYGRYGTLHEQQRIASDFVYSVSSGKATVTGYFGEIEDVVIPETLGGYPVKSIGTYAFARRDGIKTVTVEADGIIVELSAFYEVSSLVSVDVGEAYGVDLGGFTRCSQLTTFTAHSSQSHTFRLDGSFAECGALTDVTLPENTEYVAVAFLGCDALSKVTMTGEWRLEDIMGTEIAVYTASTPEENAAAFKANLDAIWCNVAYES